MVSWLRRGLREPLLHFALLGGALFGLSRWLAESGGPATIVVDRARQDRLAAELADTLGRPPTDEEREAAIQRHIDRELLYREGLALGLDRDDPVVRRRVIQKMEFVGDNLEPLAEPDDATLRAFMVDNAARYAGSSRYDLELVTFAAAPDGDDAPARAALQQLRDGADPAAVGGRLARGRRFSLANIQGTYGPEVSAATTEQPPGEWALIPLPRAFTLLRITAVHPGQPLPFEKIRNRLQVDYQASRRGAALRERLDELRERYRVQRDR